MVSIVTFWGPTPSPSMPPFKNVGERLRNEPDPLRLLHGFGPIPRAELAIERGGVLLDGVRRQEQALGDLAVGGAGGDGLEHLALAVAQRRAGGGLVGL